MLETRLPGPQQNSRQGRFHGRVTDGETRRCETVGCAEAGEFRAPRHRGGRISASDCRWLCLDHVREFNASYNYFEGMNAAEIETAQRVYAGWERETRSFAANPTAEPKWSRFTDPADILGMRFGTAAGERPRSRNGQILGEEDQRALKRLGLEPGVRLTDIRRAYAEKVRLLHPDKNGGDRRHEQALQAVISAYTHLRKSAAFR